MSNTEKRRDAELILNTAKNNGELFLIEINPPIICSPKDVTITDEGIEILPNCFLPFELISGVESNKVKNINGVKEK